MINQFKTVCKRIKRNNGIVQVLFTCESDGASQEDHILINVYSLIDKYKEGKKYKIVIMEHIGD